MACGTLVPQPGIEPGSPAVKALSPNHWTVREFPAFHIKVAFFFLVGFFKKLIN